MASSRELERCPPPFIQAFDEDGEPIAASMQPIKLFTKQQSFEATSFIYHQKYSAEEVDAMLVQNSLMSKMEKSDVQAKTAVVDDKMTIDQDKLQLVLHRNLTSLRFERSGIHMWGVVSEVPIPAGEPIIEYTGQLIRDRIVERRQAIYEKEGNNGSYIFRLNNDTNIDATKMGGMARFINHSCDPCCVSRIISAGGTEHIIICALRDIEPWEELCYDYKLPYESTDKRIKCLCGSPKCRGWLNWRWDYEEAMRVGLHYEEEELEESINLHLK